MNVLYEQFPKTVLIKGKEYRIVTDFREWIKLLELVEDRLVPPGEKVELLMQWFIDIPEHWGEAMEALGSFLKADGLYPKKRGDDPCGGEAGMKEEKPAFSYSQDAGCIFCAFWECYRIDLEKIKYMHWWKFRTLFEGLNEETEIKQRIRYRRVDAQTIKDKEERKRIKRIQREIALEINEAQVNDFDIGDIFA